MEITDVEAMIVRSDLDSTKIPSVGAVEVGSVVVTVHTDEGVTGRGESFHRLRLEDNVPLVRSVESLASHLVGEDPLAISQLWSELYVHVKRSGQFKALSAIDEALWDIKGKVAGLPVYQLLGGDAGAVTAYATFPVQKSADDLVEDGRWLAERGFDAMKITAGLGVDRDRSRIETIAPALPDGFGLAIDANTSYAFTEARSLAETAAEHDLEWFEEPIAHTDLDGYAELRARTDVPIAGYQTHTPHYPAVDHSRPARSTSTSPRSITAAA